MQWIVVKIVMEWIVVRKSDEMDCHGDGMDYSKSDDMDCSKNGEKMDWGKNGEEIDCQTKNVIVLICFDGSD